MSTYYFHAPHAMRLFKLLGPHSKQLQKTSEVLCPVLLVKTQLAIVSYDHVNNLALRICATDMFILVEEIEFGNIEVRTAIHELSNYWPKVTSDSRGMTRAKIAQLLARYGYWSGGGPLVGSINALLELA